MGIQVLWLWWPLQKCIQFHSTSSDWDKQSAETARRRWKSTLPQVFFTALTKYDAPQMLCTVWQDEGFHRNRTDWTIPVMWIGFSRNETEGVEWASSGFHRVPDYAGPIWAGNNTFLVSAFNLNTFGRGLMLSRGLQELVSLAQDLPANTHTHLDGE